MATPHLRFGDTNGPGRQAPGGAVPRQMTAGVERFVARMITHRRRCALNRSGHRNVPSRCVDVFQFVEVFDRLAHVLFSELLDELSGPAVEIGFHLVKQRVAVGGEGESASIEPTSR